MRILKSALMPGVFLLSLAGLSIAATIDVDIQFFDYDPDPVNIQVGDTVRWTNLDAAPHTATSDDGIWDSGILTNGQSFEFKFLKPGSFSYHCDVHPATMKDKLVNVQGSLGADTDAVPATAGGTVNFVLEAGTVNGNRNYILLGSVSGTLPGIPLPGGIVTLPLNWDVFMNLTISLANTALFQDFLGTLDAAGSATATMNLPPVPGAPAVTMNFAFALDKPWDFASNPFAVNLVP